MHPWNEPVFAAVKRTLARLPHALLVHGPRGVGKLALAERIAQLLLCEQTEAAERPCGRCEGCRWFVAGTHPDFRRLEPEALAPEPVVEEGEEGSEGSPSRSKKPSLLIKVEQVRDLAGFLNLRSHRGRLRVALVHPAEDMNANAANALLKGLEEPPAGAVFVLVSHRSARLLPTIRSRCIAYAVGIPPAAEAAAWLQAQGAKDPARWLAFAGGAPLQALRYAEEAGDWERLLKAPGPVHDREDLERLAEALQKIAYDRALASFGLPPKYQTGWSKPGDARGLLAYARALGEQRLLTRHPLNPRLFSEELLAGLRHLT